MKKLSYLLSAGVLVALFAIVGCGDDNGGGLSAVDAAGVNFEGTWIVGSTGSVTFDTQDRSSDYGNFTLNVTYNTGQGSGSYTATGGPTGSSPWPTSGNWSFQSDSPGANSFVIVREDNLNVNVTITETNMTLTFNYDDSINAGSRTQAVNGEWEFILVPQQ